MLFAFISCFFVFLKLTQENNRKLKCRILSSPSFKRSIKIQFIFVNKALITELFNSE